MKLPKDLLGLIFWEIESGHDMINFSELNRKCHQIFRQNLVTLKAKNPFGDLKISMKKKKSCWEHGLYRSYNQLGQVVYESNYFQGSWHGYRSWYRDGQIAEKIYYHHGILIEK